MIVVLVILLAPAVAVVAGAVAVALYNRYEVSVGTARLSVMQDLARIASDAAAFALVPANETYDIARCGLKDLARRVGATVSDDEAWVLLNAAFQQRKESEQAAKLFG